MGHVPQQVETKTQNTSCFHFWLYADKQVFSKLDIVGWYATGEEVQEADMLIHRKASLKSSFNAPVVVSSSAQWCCHLHPQVMELNESPVFLLFHTQQSVMRKDLPVSLFESGKASD